MVKDKEEKTQLSVVDPGSMKQEKQATSANLSKHLGMLLINLIEEVNADGVTPETVNASCNVAKEIHKLLSLNFEMKKNGY